jgi:AbrB family looped-hinge helix DNA binding protein
MAQTKVTSKGQVVIPKSVRSLLRWRPGTQLNVQATREGTVILSPRRRQSRGDFESLIELGCGLLSRGDPLSDLEADHRAELERDGRRRP